MNIQTGRYHEDQIMLHTTTSKLHALGVSFPIVLGTVSISIGACLLLIPNNPSPFPSSLAEFVELTAARLNAAIGNDYHVIGRTGGQEQFWITTEPGCNREGMLKKSKLLSRIHQWQDTVVVFHNDCCGTIASDPEETAAGCVDTIGQFVIFGDPPLVERVKQIWENRKSATENPSPIRHCGGLSP
jgi:hypothetical protein